MAFIPSILSNLASSTFLGNLNANFQKVATEFTKVLYKDGSSFMTGTLDVNSNAIINVPDARSRTQAPNLGQVQDMISAIPIIAVTAASYDMVPNGSDQTAEFNAKINQPGRRTLSIAPGITKISNPPSVANATYVTDTTDLTLDLNGGGLVHTWNPLDPSSLSRTGLWTDNQNFTIQNGYLDYSPRTYWQGSCVARTATYYDVAVQPGFEPQFKTMDNVLRILFFNDGSRYGITDFQNDTANPAAITDTGTADPRGWKIFRVTPVDRMFTPTSVVSYNPLVLRLPNNIAVGDEYTTVAGASGAFSFLNGNTYQLSIDEDVPNVATLIDSSGNTVDASAAVGTTTYGTFTIPGVPAFVQTGRFLVGQCRKRFSQSFFLRRMKGTTTFRNFNIRQSLGIAIYGNTIENLFLDDLKIMAVDGGLMACNGGPIQLFNVRGEISGSLEIRGSGDDGLNPRSRAWDLSTTAYDVNAGWVDVLFSPETNNDLRQIGAAPYKGDIIEVYPPSTIGMFTRTVIGTSVSLLNPLATRVQFDGDLKNGDPTGYVPTASGANSWLMLNRSTVGTIKMDKFHHVGSAARALVGQTHSLYIEDFYACGTRGTPTRNQFPNSPRGPYDGGFKGGHTFGLFRTEHTTYNHRKDSNAAAMARAFKIGDATPIDAPTGWPAMVYGTMLVDDAQYGVFYASGVNMIINSHTWTNIGGGRSSIPSGYPGKYDGWARYSTVLIGDPLSSTSNFFLDTGGTISVLSSDATKLDKTGGALTGPLSGTSLTMSGLITGGSVSTTTATAGTQTVTTLNLLASADLTIAGDAITVTGSFHRVATEGGAATDNLMTINGGVEGQLLTLTGSTGGQVIVLAGGGNISAPFGITITQFRRVTLRYTAGSWQIVSVFGRRDGELEHSSGASQNYNVNTAPENIIVTGALTADINIGLASTGAAKGDRFVVDAQHTGAFNVVVRNNNGVGTILATLPPGTTGRFRYNGTAWQRLGTTGSAGTP